MRKGGHRTKTKLAGDDRRSIYIDQEDCLSCDLGDGLQSITKSSYKHRKDMYKKSSVETIKQCNPPKHHSRKKSKCKSKLKQTCCYDREESTRRKLFPASGACAQEESIALFLSFSSLYFCVGFSSRFDVTRE